ncbi:ribokinase [Caldicellulosiruptoraceae bacterium PP1]
MKKICVIGSLNIDIVTSIEGLPKIGETIFSKTFDVFVGGGKGANQAVALGKLGADVRMVGRLGSLFYGPEYLEVLKKYNIKCDTVEILEDIYPGIAVVTVVSGGNNMIYVYPGANQMVNEEYIDKIWNKITECDIFLFQMEIPLGTTLYTIKKLKQLEKTIILDPAPAVVWRDEILSYVDYITPNEVELATLAQTPILIRPEDYYTAGQKLIEKGANIVIAKAGEKGSFIIGENIFEHIPAFKVKPIDTTAAGDSFNAGFAYALANGTDNLFDCVRFANAVGALSTTAIGAQTAMPTLEKVYEFLNSYK